MAPTDKIGPVDVFQTSYHGADFGNNPVLVETIKPRVAVINNGPAHSGWWIRSWFAAAMRNIAAQAYSTRRSHSRSTATSVQSR